jgi:hypothetical protein
MIRRKEQGPLLPEDRPRWEAADTLEDLAELTIAWLTGEMKSQPFYFGPVDVDEAKAPGLTAALVACNRAGLLTNDSQAGFDGAGADGARWTQLAAVTGFMHEDRAVRLAELAAADGRFNVRYDGLPRLLPRIPVTCRNGEGHTWYGGGPNAELADELYGECNPGAVDDVTWSSQVTVWDPVPGRNGLWEFLAGAAGTIIEEWWL